MSKMCSFEWITLDVIQPYKLDKSGYCYNIFFTEGTEILESSVFKTDLIFLLFRNFDKVCIRATTLSGWSFDYPFM